MELIVTSHVAFFLIVGAMAFQLLILAAISARNVARQTAKGAVIVDGSGIGRLNIVLRSGWLLAMLAEVEVFQRPFSWPIFILAGVATAIAFALRVASMRQLGERWSLPTMVMPGGQPESSGIYRYLRHPNWLGVGMEIVSVPMLHGAWLTAVFFLALELLLLRHRARVEADALTAAALNAAHILKETDGDLFAR